MRIIILDTLLEQKDDRRISKEILKCLNEELRVLSHLERRGPCAIISYLKHNDDGIKMKGGPGKGNIPIFKFRISSGDRILYTYGKYLPYISDEDDSVVLLEFSPHDNQAQIAKTRDFTVNHKYDYVKGTRQLHITFSVICVHRSPLTLHPAPLLGGKNIRILRSF